MLHVQQAAWAGLAIPPTVAAGGGAFSSPDEFAGSLDWLDPVPVGPHAEAAAQQSHSLPGRGAKRRANPLAPLPPHPRRARSSQLPRCAAPSRPFWCSTNLNACYAIPANPAGRHPWPLN